MTRRYSLLLLAGLVVGLLISGRLALTAQDRAESTQSNANHSPSQGTGESSKLPALRATRPNSCHSRSLAKVSRLQSHFRMRFCGLITFRFRAQPRWLKSALNSRKH